MNGPMNRPDALKFETILDVARERADALARHGTTVIETGDADSIHDLRVATRRLQQTVDFLWAEERPKRVRKLRRTVQRTRRAVSKVRNHDVFFGELNDCASRARTHRDEWTKFLRFLSEERGKSLEK